MTKLHTPVLIGEAPGYHEDQEGRPFIGPAGRFLDKLLDAAQVPRESLFITNMVACRPPGNRKPEKDEMKACLPRIRELLWVLKPSSVVLMGDTPLRGVLGIHGITRRRGFQYFQDLDLMNTGRAVQVALNPTYHPSYLLRTHSKQFIRETILDLYNAYIEGSGIYKVP